MMTRDSRASLEEALTDFSLVQGGPMMRLMARLGLERPGRRALAMVLVTWVPLAVLSAVSSLGGGNEISRFLVDMPALVRFLVAAPLLIFAETRVHRFTAQVARQMLGTGLVRESDRERFRRALKEVVRGRESRIAEAVIVILAYLASLIWFRNEMRGGEPDWHARQASKGLAFLPAGFWYVFVSVPIYQFLIYRWVYRILLWVRFQWRMARLDLDLYVTHPDQAGGLGFLGLAQTAFAPIIFASAAVTSALQGERILKNLTTFDSIQWSILVLVVVIYPLLLLGPLAVFAPQLTRVRRRGELEATALGQRYVRLFHQRWGGGRGSDEDFLGSSDIQSLADSQNSLAAAMRMRILPVNKSDAVSIVLAGALPFVPLVLTKIPLETILKMLFKVAA
jgi:hypothetical protein